jgi:hypothetical protein
MSISSYLEAKPLSEIEKYNKGPPKNSIPCLSGDSILLGRKSSALSFLDCKLKDKQK